MSLRIVDQQMMLQRPPEMMADRVREIRQMATNPNMNAEVARETLNDNTRVKHLSETEKSSIRPDEDGHKKQEYEGRRESGAKKEEELPPDKKELLMKQASARLINLPVERGRYARREEHSIDIQV